MSAVVFPLSSDHTTIRWKWFGYSFAYASHFESGDQVSPRPPRFWIVPSTSAVRTFALASSMTWMRARWSTHASRSPSGDQVTDHAYFVSSPGSRDRGSPSPSWSSTISR